MTNEYGINYWKIDLTQLDRLVNLESKEERKKIVDEIEKNQKLE